jgi:hypothetical protein
VSDPTKDGVAATAQLCGSFGCIYPLGHNRGRADIPENHSHTALSPKKVGDRVSELRVSAIPYMTVAIERYATSAGASGFRAVAEVTPGELPPISVVEPTVREALLAIVERLDDFDA